MGTWVCHTGDGSHKGTQYWLPFCALVVLPLLWQALSLLCPGESHRAGGRPSILVTSFLFFKFHCTQLQSPWQEYYHWEESRKSYSPNFSTRVSKSRGCHWGLLCTHGYEGEKDMTSCVQERSWSMKKCAVKKISVAGIQGGTKEEINAAPAMGKAS